MHRKTLWRALKAHWGTKRAALILGTIITLAVTAIGGAAYATVTSNKTVAQPYCADPTLSSDDDAGLVHVQFNCTVPIPDASVITQPVPTTVTETVTTPVPTTATSTVTVTVPPAPTTPAPTTTTSSTPPAPPTTTAPPPPPPGLAGFPTEANTGVPAGWVPATTRGSWTISQPGTYENVRVNGGVNVNASGVILRNVEVIGGRVVMGGSACSGTPLLLENVTLRPADGQTNVLNTEGAVSHGNYTLRRVKILNYAEGPRVSNCGPVQIHDSYIKINNVGQRDSHADGIQGYGGRGLVLRNSVIDARNLRGGTAPFFYPSGQNNPGRVDVDGLYIMGGGNYSFRLGMPARVRNVAILDGSWSYKEIVDVKCSAMEIWQNVRVVNASGATIRTIACGGPLGGS